MKLKSTLSRQVARSAIGSFILSVCLSGLQFVTSVVLARILGTSGYGAYIYALTWVGLLSIPAGLGLSQLLVRDFAAYRVKGAWEFMKGLQRWANFSTLCASMSLAGITGVVAWVLQRHLDPQVFPTLVIALCSLPLIALLRVRQSILRGLNYVVLGQTPEVFFQPVLLLISVAILYAARGNDLTASWVMGASTLATGLALLIAVQLLHKRLPQTVKDATAAYQRRTWFRSAMPLLLIGGLFILNSRAVILVLGTLAGTEPVGLYNVAMRGVELLSFALNPVVLAVEPHLASLYAGGNLPQLQSLATKSARIVLLLSLPVAIAFIAFGDWFLLVFGPGFTKARYALLILTAGQLANFAAGLVIPLSVMTGHEKDAVIGAGVGAALNVVLSPFFINKWGLEGAALATTISTITWNVFMVVRVRSRLGIDSTALGLFGLRRKET
jgi:O-antigen/teichoic acid export membrane protein